MFLFICNVILLVIMVIIVFNMYLLFNSFAEIIVRFAEQNQEFNKSQKHLLSKANDLAVSLKKLSATHTTLKRTVDKLDVIQRSVDTKIKSQKRG